MNARKPKKEFLNLKKIYMPLTLFEFHEKFMLGAFLIKLTQFEKAESVGKIFISLKNLIIKFQN